MSDLGGIIARMGPDDRRAGYVSSELLAAHAGLRRRVVDEHMFDPGLRWVPHARFRVQLFSAPGLRSVAVVTQMPGEGTSLVNAAERYAEVVWRRLCPEQAQPPLWIQRLLVEEQDSTSPYAGELVTFTVEDQTLTAPRFGPGVTAQELAKLVGMPVDTGRGNQTEVEPDLDLGAMSVMVYEPMPVARLPRPGPDADRGCRPAGIPQWQARARRLIPRRRGRVCCWYHGGDWHEVSAMAIDLLRQVQAAGVSDHDELTHEVLQRARRAGWEDEEDWRWLALKSLFTAPIQIDDELRGMHVNGRHRTQAMLDAGVRTTVVGHWQQPT
jgi:hypothetical protein